VTNITSNNLVSASISPGQAVACAGFTSIYYDSTFVSHFNLKFEISSNGFVYWSMDTTVYVSLSAVDDETLSLITYNLEQNYPNPFNPTTTIKYQIPHRSNVSLKIYDIIGNEVAELVNAEQEVGYYNIDFNAAKFSSGVYFYRLQAGSFVQTRKMILMK
jgi:hypothetical protein